MGNQTECILYSKSLMTLHYLKYMLICYCLKRYNRTAGARFIVESYHVAPICTSESRNLGLTSTAVQLNVYYTQNCEHTIDRFDLYFTGNSKHIFSGIPLPKITGDNWQHAEEKIDCC